MRENHSSLFIIKLRKMPDKKALRQEIRRRKQQFSARELMEQSRGPIEGLRSIIGSEATILLYWSMPDEVYTHELVQELYKKGHKVLLPTVKEDMSLELHIYSPESMHQGYKGIMESHGELFTQFDAIDLAVVPGVAFTIHGNRLGRGKGCYDRLLPRLKCKKVGLCFPFQILEEIPCEAHDSTLDRVICDSPVFETASSGPRKNT